jgi:hypothetical protein
MALPLLPTTTTKTWWQPLVRMLTSAVRRLSFQIVWRRRRQAGAGGRHPQRSISPFLKLPPISQRLDRNPPQLSSPRRLPMPLSRLMPVTCPRKASSPIRVRRPGEQYWIPIRILRTKRRKTLMIASASEWFSHSSSDVVHIYRELDEVGHPIPVCRCASRVKAAAKS